MVPISNVLDSLVPISQFNQGKASKIFDRLKEQPHLIVIKNNKPAGVIISMEEYQKLIDIEIDEMLYDEAKARLSEENVELIDNETVMKEAGITQADLDAVEDAELE